MEVKWLLYTGGVLLSVIVMLLLVRPDDLDEHCGWLLGGRCLAMLRP